MDQEYLKSILEYDTISGDFIWISPPNRRIKFGSVAGCLGNKGYWRIKIDGKYYQAHRLAWLYMTGEWPSFNIDHENTCKDDNSWENLREATGSQNSCNRSFTIDNKLGIKGVYKYKGRFRAQIQINGIKTYLGAFDTAEEATIAYSNAVTNYHGEFARL